MPAVSDLCTADLERIREQHKRATKKPPCMAVFHNEKSFLGLPGARTTSGYLTLGHLTSPLSEEPLGKEATIQLSIAIEKVSANPNSVIS